MVNTNTSIEWTEVTWSPTTGCDKVSPGCDNCYALTLAKRLKGMELGRLAKNQCTAASVPFLFKQWGEWSPRNEPWRSATYDARPASWITKHGATKPWGDFTGNELSTTKAMYRVGKKAAGRELDGRTWDQYPEVAQ